MNYRLDDRTLQHIAIMAFIHAKELPFDMESFYEKLKKMLVEREMNRKEERNEDTGY